jgi:DNA-binding NtrC family response regulator
MSGARILVVDDEANIRELLDEILSEEGYQVTTAEDAAHARAARRGQSYDLTLLDIWMPDTDGITLLKEWADGGVLDPVVMMSGHGTVDTAVEATRLGAFDFIEKPVSLTKLLRTVSKALDGKRLRDIRRAGAHSIAMPVGKSEVMRVLRQQVQQLSRHDTPVLFTGERGSGRKHIGRYLAATSDRMHGPFHVVAGRDLSDESAAAVLLGETEQPGALAGAAGGFLFINGLEELSRTAENILLGVLQSGRLPASAGGAQLKLRVLSAAPPGFELESRMNQDLLSLLSTVVIRVPPLREYAEDVPELLRLHAEQLVDEENLPFRRFSVAAQNRLRNYPWPGNVRELQNVV